MHIFHSMSIMNLTQNITKESDPVRQRHYTTKRLWLVNFTNIFWFILKLFVTVHTPLSREVFWHEYAKIPRHTSQNSIAAGNLEWILAMLLRTEWTVTETLRNLYKFSHYHCYFLVKRVYFKALNTRSTKLWTHTHPDITA